MYARLPDGKENLFQWDTKQYLEVSQDVTRVDFCFRVDPDTVYGVIAKKGICYIPNLLLQKAGIVDALIMSTEIGTVTDRRLEIPVFERPIPPGYVATKDGAIISYDELEDILGEMNFLKTTGGTMSGDINMDQRKITGLVDPVGDSDAVRKRYVDTNFMKKNGDTLDGPLYGLPAPERDDEAVNKGYTDGLFAKYTEKVEKTYQLKKRVFTDCMIQAGAWQADSTYPARPFRAAIPLDGVNAADIAQVVFSDNDLQNYGLGANAVSYNGGVYVYIDQVPPGSLNVPTILIWR
nr:MAG TPA: tail fiber protein [Caudoviricetes sp.]